jgi:3'-phosphoadenosine 5'-phosphosulfate sulfotransferase (PAPS reductase)/FAD synthetase
MRQLTLALDGEKPPNANVQPINIPSGGCGHPHAAPPGLDLRTLLSAPPPPAFAADHPLRNLRSYDIICVNSSAGKDSMAMLDLVIEHATAQGTLDRVVVIHADLGRVEWEGTRELAETQAQRYGVRFEICGRDDTLLDYIRRRGKFPDAARRYCTSDFKRGPIRTVFTRLVAERWERGGSPVRVLNLMGMRAQESPARRKMAPVEPEVSASNGKREVTRVLPLHNWSEEQVWARIMTSPINDLIHEAYSFGMRRLSCRFCVFAPKAALVIAARRNPELAREYADLEAEIGHRFTQRVSMAEVLEAASSDDQPDMEVEAWAA